jgi:hypothetical protein
VSSEERSQLKAVERFIKKTIQVDRDHPFHSDEADRKAGKASQGLAQAEWIHPANRNRNKAKRNNRKSFKGRRQPDFGQK